MVLLDEEVGSGATIISKDAYWSEQLSDEEYEAAKGDCAEKGLVINSKEHLINLRTYIKVFWAFFILRKSDWGLVRVVLDVVSMLERKCFAIYAELGLLSAKVILKSSKASNKTPR
jgi:hypothetical protein